MSQPSHAATSDKTSIRTIVRPGSSLRSHSSHDDLRKPLIRTPALRNLQAHDLAMHRPTAPSSTYSDNVVPFDNLDKLDQSLWREYYSKSACDRAMLAIFRWKKGSKGIIGYMPLSANLLQHMTKKTQEHIGAGSKGVLQASTVASVFEFVGNVYTTDEMIQQQVTLALNTGELLFQMQELANQGVQLESDHFKQFFKRQSNFFLTDEKIRKESPVERINRMKTALRVYLRVYLTAQETNRPIDQVYKEYAKQSQKIAASNKPGASDSIASAATRRSEDLAASAAKNNLKAWLDSEEPFSLEPTHRDNQSQTSSAATFHRPSPLAGTMPSDPSHVTAAHRMAAAQAKLKQIPSAPGSHAGSSQAGGSTHSTEPTQGGVRELTQEEQEALLGHARKQAVFFKPAAAPSAKKGKGKA